MSPSYGIRCCKALSNTLFPDPFGPMIARQSPEDTSKIKSRRTTWFPKAARRSRTDRTRSVMGILASRLATQPAPMAVLDEEIGGNRLLSEGAFQAGANGFARFGRD